ncbi:hypothetical protein M231_02342 [Tremella mesenterica]|uniref:Uncharacterized protein n=1 Tax=Tremella mesenterica TaxID=5217 RepID=A0A4Q1BQY5_TREME|nr:hypothetical protein M231_02342 [Tremella mesenterica]
MAAFEKFNEHKDYIRFRIDSHVLSELRLLDATEELTLALAKLVASKDPSEQFTLGSLSPDGVFELNPQPNTTSTEFEEARQKWQNRWCEKLEVLRHEQEITLQTMSRDIMRMQRSAQENEPPDYVFPLGLGVSIGSQRRSRADAKFLSTFRSGLTEQIQPLREDILSQLSPELAKQYRRSEGTLKSSALTNNWLISDPEPEGYNL